MLSLATRGTGTLGCTCVLWLITSGLASQNDPGRQSDRDPSSGEVGAQPEVVYWGRTDARRVTWRERGGRSIVAAIDRGLEWLAGQQTQSGCWVPADRAGSDVVATGLAVLAFVGDGRAARGGRYRGQVVDGIRWLQARQSQDGRIARGLGLAAEREHAIALCALVEAACVEDRTSDRSSACIQRARRWLTARGARHREWVALGLACCIGSHDGRVTSR